MALPEYDEDAAKAANDWADVRGAPDQLHDVPTRCVFCGEFIPITKVDPLLVVATPWQQPASHSLYAAHESCLQAAGERTGTR